MRWGILGPGAIARQFAGELSHSRTGRLVAVASRDAERARSFAAEFGAPSEPRVTSYGSYQELLDDEQVDAVYLPTVNTTHHELVVRSAEAGRHVLVEKPLAVTHAWAVEAVTAARTAGVFLAEGSPFRFHPQTALVRELVEQGEIGRVHSIEAACAYIAEPHPDARPYDAGLGGGGIVGVGCFPVSMARLVAGAAVGAPYLDPEAVTAVGTVGETGVDEWSVATLTFGTGVTARVSAGVRAGDDNVVKIYGSRGHLYVPLPWVLPPTQPGAVVLTTVGVGRRTLHTPSAYVYAREADAVGLRGDRQQAPEIGWDDSLGNARTLDRWRAAIGQAYPFEGPGSGEEPQRSTTPVS